MWSLFFFGVFICTVFLFLPGYFLLRSLRFSPFLSFALSPSIVLLETGLACVAASALTIQANWMVVFVTPLILNCIAFLVSRQLCKGGPIITLPHEGENHFWRIELVYIGVAFVVTCVFFIMPLDGPATFFVDNDATLHLNAIQHFLDSGDWTIWRSGYYPDGYMRTSAMVAQMLNVNAPFAANILVSTLLIVVFPTSMLSFLAYLFCEHPRMIYCGSISVLALSGFPWGFIEINQIGPNLLGFSLLPAGITLFLLLTQSKVGLQWRILSCAAFLLLLASCLFTHPNTIFTLAVCLLPLAIWRITSAGFFAQHTHPVLAKSAAIAIAITFFIAFWALCYNLPFLSSTVNYEPRTLSPYPKWEIIQLVFALGYNNPAQFIAAPLVFVGIVYTLRNRKYLWITAAALLFAIIFFCNLGFDGTLRRIFAGFWYSAPRRVYGALCIMCIPLLAIGISVFVKMCSDTLSSQRRKPLKSSSNSKITTSFAALTAVLLFFPSFSLPNPTGSVVTTFGYIYESICSSSNPDKSILEQNERDFLKEVKQYVGADKVFNLPYDGSAYAYTLNQINTNLERLVDNATEEGIVLQNRLNDIANDPEVQAAANALGIKYILYLDTPLDESSTAFTHIFEQDDWKGYLDVDENTPGLELVLGNGDMRLYKIDESLTTQ